jgi:8-oxo-dGTP pyrophosphatase MutT (NUDIX family)
LAVPFAATATALRDLLLSEDDAAALDVPGRIDAAVLVPLYLDDDGRLHAVFTERRHDMRRHAGEISFPGGRQDVGEEDLRETALREAEEEIGLPRDAVEIVGALTPTPTVVTNYAIYPFVAMIEPRQAWQVSPSEVAAVLELNVCALRDGHARRRLIRRGIPFQTDVYEVDGHFIWGATARIVTDLIDRIGPILDRNGSATA